MSNKIANLIAIELGVLIAILSWLAFSNPRGVSAPPTARPPMRLVDSFATVAPLPHNPPPAPIDYRADPAPEAQLEEAPPQVVQDYEQGVATVPYTDPEFDAGYIDQTAPYYEAVEPEPATSDCLFAPVDRYVAYPQPTTIVIVSNSHNFEPRPGSPGCPDRTRPPSMRRRPPASPSHDGGGGGGGGAVAPRQKPLAKFPRPSAKPRPRQNP